MRVLSNPRFAVAVSVLLLVTFALLSWTAVSTKSPTMDESLHAVGAYAHAFDGDFHINPEDPPLWKYWAMLPHARADLRLNRADPDFNEIFTQLGKQLWFCANSLYRTPGVDGIAFINRSRAIMLLLPILLGAMVMLWSWRLAGPLACVFAGVLFAFDPNFLAHGPLVKNDVAIALLMFALMFAIYFLGQRLTLWTLLPAVIICALGPVVKYSGLLFFPMLVAALLIRALLTRPWPVFKRVLRTRAQRFLTTLVISIIAVGVSWMVIWAVYGFRYSPTADRSLNFDFTLQVNNAVQNAHAARHHELFSVEELDGLPRPPLVRAVIWANDRRLLPQSWLYGLLFTYQSALIRPAFLLGDVSATGWWYYFPLAMLFKTPLATLFVIAVACAFAAQLLIRRRMIVDHWPLICVGLPIVLYGYSALTSNLNLGIRHVLLLYPFLYLAAAVVLAKVLTESPRYLPVAYVVALALAVETIIAHPNYIPFFNAAATAWRPGIVLLSDSNLDWGQDLPALARWRRQHPDEKLYLCYFGTADPAVYGIQYTNLPSGYLLEPSVQLPTTPGIIAVSATKLQGMNVHPNVIGFYETLRQLPPREVLNGTIYLYDWPPRHAH